MSTCTRGEMWQCLWAKELALNIVIVTRERNKDSLMVHNVELFAALRSKEPDVRIALDLLKMQCGMGERSKK